MAQCINGILPCHGQINGIALFFKDHPEPLCHTGFILHQKNMGSGSLQLLHFHPCLFGLTSLEHLIADDFLPHLQGLLYF